MLRDVVVACLEFVDDLAVGLPVTQVCGLQHALDRLGERVGIMALESVLEPQLVLVAHETSTNSCHWSSRTTPRATAVQPKKLLVASTT